MKKGSHFTPEQLERVRLTRIPGFSGHRHSPESLEKQRLAKLGKKLSEEHKRKIGDACRGYKHTPEAKEKIRLAHIGKRFMHGKHFTEEHRYKLSLAHKGKPRSEETKRKLSRAFSGKKRPNLGGPNSPNWKGGIYPLNLSIRHWFEYRQWRSDIFTRDAFTCQSCGIRGGILQVHHSPKSFSDIITEYKIKTQGEALACAELWNINNGITLCIKCHNKTRRKKDKMPPDNSITNA